MPRLRHLIIGGGPAGLAAAETIRALSEKDEVTIVTEERHLPYSRMLLPDYLIGRVAFETLWLRDAAYYAKARIHMRLGARITAVRPERGLVVTEDGEEIPFDRLLLASGARSRLPAIEGIERARPLTLKTLDDAQRLMAEVARGCSVLVIGRDLIGVEMTRAFCHMGSRVTYIEWDDAVLPHIIDPATAEELAGVMRAAGVRMVLGEGIRKVETSEGAVSVHTDSKRISGDRLAVAVGTTPALDWLQNSGIMVGNGIIIDERLRTSYPNIFAAGDGAEVYDPAVGKRTLVFGWKNALEQGRTAGANMRGEMRDFSEAHLAYVPGVKQIFGIDIRHRWK